MPRGRKPLIPKSPVPSIGRSDDDDDEESVSSDICVGHTYLVAWKSGQQHTAEIIDRRRLKSSDINDADGGEYEYYVHYCNFDRRMDEWVSVDRIQTAVEGEKKNKKYKRKFDDISISSREEKTTSSVLNQLEKEHEEITKVKNIQTIEFGRYEVDTWYFSPYPDEYCSEDKLYICEYCLKYMKKKSVLEGHKAKCTTHHPPGREIYREHDLAMYEIDGKECKIYCQNLCLLAKLFLDHKTLYYDVDSFLFYILCEIDEEGTHIVGYFSKEKQSADNYNLACILTFPPYQRKGYGKFLISFSYELTKREGTTGSPEKPLSDLGKISYRSYWSFVILNYLSKNLNTTTIQDIATQTGIKTEDILSTLHSLNLIKYWKGQHVISITPTVIEAQIQQAHKFRVCNPNCLHWEPPDKASKSQK